MADNQNLDFKESKVEKIDVSQPDLLSRRINELALKIQGTALESLINKLYQELSQKGIDFKPKCYLSDDWGCPSGIPIIGIPFYLADPELSQLEGKYTGIEAENSNEIMMFLRHEAGHAFCYAYKLFSLQEWRSLFGLFSTPYKEDYKPRPFSPEYVRHIPGWYAQKHPDEDFAETFAVWLNPEIDWKKRYNDTPALSKLMFVDRVAVDYGKKPPLVTEEILDSPIEELTDTLIEWYNYNKITNLKINLPNIINEDLRILFPNTEPESASAVDFLNSNHYLIMQKINRWTGVDIFLVGSLVDELIKRVKNLDLKYLPAEESKLLADTAAFVNTLAMNYLYTGKFVL